MIVKFCHLHYESGQSFGGIFFSDIDECRDDLCLNGATCNNFDGSYSCDCASGWTSPLCETGMGCLLYLVLRKHTRLLIDLSALERMSIQSPLCLSVFPSIHMFVQVHSAQVQNHI